MKTKVPTIEYRQMTDEQQRNVNVGNQPAAGTVPPGLDKAGLVAWIEQTFGWR